MKLVICYARIDKQICSDIVPMLIGHDIWYDGRDYVMDSWWDTILERLDWCDVLIYLLTPESLQSHYCQKEFEVARKLNKVVVPIALVDGLSLSSELCDLQPVDWRDGWHSEVAKKQLLKAMVRAEGRKVMFKPTSVYQLPEALLHLYPDNHLTPVRMIGRAADAMSDGDYDNAVLLLKHAKARGYSSRYIDVDSLLSEAESAFNRLVAQRLIHLAYRNIVEQVKNRETRRIGCEALQKFHEYHPLYDPDNLVSICDNVIPEMDITMVEYASMSDDNQSLSLPLLRWCDIPSGNVLTPDNEVVLMEAFRISKYPVTNAQYQVFVDDEDGYDNIDWWRFSQYALSWFKRNRESHAPYYAGDERPRENVTWYEAMAYCNWLSVRLNKRISLPTSNQWRRAAQGDDGRLYPWGNDFDKEMCNTRESRIRMTTAVLRYEQSMSPFGVMDLAGNVWEWCLDPIEGMEREVVSKEPRALQGGSFITSSERAQSTFRFFLDPQYFYATIGFRIICLD